MPLDFRRRFCIIIVRKRMWLNGRASASQAEGCEFESRRPLQFYAGVAQRQSTSLVMTGLWVQFPPPAPFSGDLAQQVRALRSHRRGHRFESYNPHHCKRKGCSSRSRVASFLWGYSAVGSASASHAEGRGFESPYLHQD